MKKTIYFAGGCFWGTDHLFSLIEGVEKTVAGYANSRIADPTYEMVCSGRTGAAEAVEVVYDDATVSLTELLMIYFRSINPTTLNRQGNDIGTQYRTGIYYVDQEYLYKNPDGYCHIDPALFKEVKNRKAKGNDKAELRARLTPLQWEVTQYGWPDFGRRTTILHQFGLPALHSLGGNGERGIWKIY